MRHSPTVLAARRWRVAILSGIALLLRNCRKLRGAATSFSGVRLGYSRSSLTTPSRLLRNMGRFPRFRHRSISQESPPSKLLAAGEGGRRRGGKSFRACDGGACDALRTETRFHCDGIPSERVGLIPRTRNTRASGDRDELPDPKPPTLRHNEALHGRAGV